MICTGNTVQYGYCTRSTAGQACLLYERYHAVPRKTVSLQRPESGAVCSSGQGIFCQRDQQHHQALNDIYATESSNYGLPCHCLVIYLPNNNTSIATFGLPPMQKLRKCAMRRQMPETLEISCYAPLFLLIPPKSSLFLLPLCQARSLPPPAFH